MGLDMLSKVKTVALSCWVGALKHHIVFKRAVMPINGVTLCLELHLFVCLFVAQVTGIV